MSRLIWVPQYPTRMRYQEWHYRDYYEQLHKAFDNNVVVLGEVGIFGKDLNLRWLK